MSKAIPTRLGIALVVAFSLLLTGLAVAYAEGEGVISGKVLNKTQGSTPIAGLEVTLTIMAHQAPGPTQVTTTDAEGNFRFDKLVTAGNFGYQMSTKHGGVQYGSDLVIFQSGETQKTADITAYDSTDKLESLVIERAHVILGQPSADQTIPVMEILILRNQGDLVIVGGGPDEPTIKVALPPEAKGLQLAPEIAAGAIETPDGFGFVQPVMPGANELLYSYELSYLNATFDLNRSFYYPVQQVTLLSPDKGLKLSSAQLIAQAPRDINGQSYLNLLGENLSAGSVITVRLEGLPVPSPLSALLDKFGWAQPAIVGLAVVAVMAFIFLRRRRQDGGDHEDYEDDGAEEFAGDELDDEAEDVEADEEFELEDQPPRGR